jgi:hypothetical protein
MAQVVEHLPSKLMAFSSNPCATKTKKKKSERNKSEKQELISYV